MNLLDSLVGGQNNSSLLKMAERFGLNTDQVQSVMGQLAPSLSSSMANHAQQNGLPSLLGLLSPESQTQYDEDSTVLQHPQAVETGNNILGQLFGSKDVSRQVAETTSQQTGVGSDTIKKMLPMVAVMAMNAFHQKNQQLQKEDTQFPSGGAVGQLTQFLGGGKQQHNNIAESLMGMMGQR